METVTLFGDPGPVEEAIADELRAHELAVHLVSTQTGWLRTAGLTIANLDSPSGAAAVEGLADTDESDADVVVVCQDVPDESLREQSRQLCRRCAGEHGITLVWHGWAPSSVLDDDPLSRTAGFVTLAKTVVDRLQNMRRGGRNLVELRVGVLDT